MSRLFPELDDTHDDPHWLRGAPTPEQPTRDTREVAPRSRDPEAVMDAGRDGLALLDRLCAVAPSIARLLSATVFASTRLEMRWEMSSLEHELVRVWLGDRNEPTKFLVSEHWSLWYESDHAQAAHAGLARWIARRLERLPLDVLSRCLSADPEAQERPREHSLEAYEKSNSLNYSYAHAATWKNFVEGQNNFRGMCSGTFVGRVLTVHHADVECAHNAPPPRGEAIHFFNHFSQIAPDANPSRDTLLQPYSAVTSLSTQMNDREVIVGADSKLDALLHRVSTWNTPPELVMLIATCISQVAGDDLGASASKLRRKLPVPVLHLGSPESPMHEAVLQVLEEQGLGNEPAHHDAINLVGFPRAKGMEALCDLLADAGIRVNVSLLPDVDLASLRRYRAACLQVFYPWAWHDKTRSLLQERAGMPSLSLDAPFGWSRSVAWLRAIAHAVNRSREMDEVLEKQVYSLHSQWEQLCVRARGYKLGIIGDDAALTRMTQPETMLGIALPAVLEEFGFHLDVWRYLPSRAATSRCEWDGPRVTVHPFATQEALEASLQTSTAGAFYSDYFFDRRITRTGHAVFSLEQFAPGPRGAIQTLQKLLRRCEMSFYRRHSEHLGNAFSREGT